MYALRFATLVLVVCCGLLAVLGGISRAHAQCIEPPSGSIACGNPGGTMVVPTDGALETNFSLLAASRYAEISARWWMSRTRVAPVAPLTAVRESRWVTTAGVKSWAGRAVVR